MSAALAESPVRDVAALRELLQRRFPGTTRLERPHHGVLTTGIGPVDSLLPGGVPRGAATLFSGPPSSGKTGIALRVAAGLTRDGGEVAWVHRGALSVASATWAGVEPARLLQVQAESDLEALRCADILLRWQAFHLVVLDWIGPGGHGGRWARLQKLVVGTQSSLLVLAPPPGPGDPLRFVAAVHLAVERVPERPAQAVTVELDKTRFGRPAGSAWATVEHDGMAGAPFALDPDLPGLGQLWHEEV